MIFKQQCSFSLPVRRNGKIKYSSQNRPESVLGVHVIKAFLPGLDVYKRQAQAIVKTQRRANALKNVSIPMLETTVKVITEALEEKEREEFSRLKVIKSRKEMCIRDRD